MNRTTVYILVVAALIVGLAAGFGLATVIRGGGDGAQIRNARLQVGDVAPDFRLPDHQGGYVRLSDFRGESNVIIAFYPAAWTPV